MKAVKTAVSAITATVCIFCMMCALVIFANASNEVWQMSSSSSLNVRESASTSSDRVTAIPAGAKYTVTDKTTDKNYVWGKVIYDGVTGWCALNFSTHISGNLSVPIISNTADSYEKSVTIRWSEVKSADSYTVGVYMGGKLYKNFTGSALYRVLALPENKYTIAVTAKNSLVPSWSARSSNYTFSITQSLVSSITITGASSIIKGEKAKLTASVLPSTAIDKSVSWTSSDKSVADVSETGVVSAIDYGEANITCAAKDAGAQKAIYKISVTCEKGNTPYQVYSGTNNSSSSVWIKWNPSKGATGYAVYKYDAASKKYVYYRTTTQTQYVATGLQAGTIQYFKVRPYVRTASGNVFSDLSGFCRAAVLPDIPSGLTLTDLTTSSASFTWNPVSGATAYAVFKYSSSSRAYIRVAIVSSEQYTAKTSSGELCYFKIRAIKTLGTNTWFGGYSDFIRFTTVPSAPVVSVSKSGTAAVISYTAVNSATGYEVYYSTSASGAYKLMSITDYSTRTVIKYGLTAGRTYYFRVRAYNTTDSITSCSAYSAVKSIKM